MLSQTRTVMKFNEQTGVFCTDNDDGFRYQEFQMDDDVYEDMGSPDTITVTITVGDQLNVPE